MFNCIKTGFYASIPSGSFLYGDAFALPGTEWPDYPIMDPTSYLLLRVRSLTVERPPVLHIRLDTWSHWFEEQNGRVVSPAPDFGVVWTPCSTLVASPGDWCWLGYDGEPT